MKMSQTVLTDLLLSAIAYLPFSGDGARLGWVCHWSSKEATFVIVGARFFLQYGGSFLSPSQ